MDRTSLSCVRVRDDEVPKVFDAFPDYLKPSTKKKQKAPATKLSPLLQPHVQPTPEPDIQPTPGPVVLEESQPSTSAELPASPDKASLKRALDATQQQLKFSRIRNQNLASGKKKAYKKKCTSKQCYN